MNVALILLVVSQVAPTQAAPPAQSPPKTSTPPVKRAPKPDTLSIPVNGLFVTGDNALTVEGRSRVGRFAKLVKKRPGYVTVEHHSAKGGPDKRISQRRADAVMAGLGRAGVPVTRMIAVGYGDTRPAAGGPRAQATERVILRFSKAHPAPERQVERPAPTPRNRKPKFEGDPLLQYAGPKVKPALRRQLAKHFGLTRENGYESKEHGIAVDARTGVIRITVKAHDGKRAFSGALPLRILPNFDEALIRKRYTGEAVGDAFQTVIRGQKVQFLFHKGTLRTMVLLGQP